MAESTMSHTGGASPSQPGNTRRGRRAEVAPAAPRKRAGHVKIDMIAGYTLIAPQAIGFLVFVFLPIVAIFGVSLLDWQIVSGRMSFVGLQNYATATGVDPRLPGILRNTGLFIVGYVPITVALGLALAI